MTGTCEENFDEGSAFRAGLTLIRYPLGIAFFLLPWAMKFGGIVAGPIIIAIFVIINAYRSHVISKIASELNEKGVASPSGCSDWWILENSLGKVRRTSVNCYLVIFSTLQWLALLGHASTFLAFAGLNFNQAFPNPAWPGIKGDRICIGIGIGIVILVHAVTQWFRNTMQKSECFVINVCSSFLLILLPALFSVFVALPAIVTHVSRLAREEVPLHPTIKPEWMEIGLLLAGIIFVTGATPDDVTSTYGSLRNRVNFPLILLTISAITIVLGIGFAVSVFLGLDNTICGSVTFNLPLHGGINYAVRIISSICALIFVAFRHQIEPKLSNRLSAAEIVCDIVFKVIFLGVAGGLAVGVPTYSGIACLFGSLTSFSLTLTFPFLCDLMLHVTGGRTAEHDREELVDGEGASLVGASPEPQERSLSAARIVRDVIFIVLGLAGMVGGLYTTVMYMETTNGGHLRDCAWSKSNGTTLA